MLKHNLLDQGRTTVQKKVSAFSCFVERDTWDISFPNWIQASVQEMNVASAVNRSAIRNAISEVSINERDRPR